MTYEPKEREILDLVVAALHGHYGERLSKVVLFGSRARRDPPSKMVVAHATAPLLIGVQGRASDSGRHRTPPGFINSNHRVGNDLWLAAKADDL